MTQKCKKFRRRLAVVRRNEFGRLWFIISPLFIDVKTIGNSPSKVTETSVCGIFLSEILPIDSLGAFEHILSTNRECITSTDVVGRFCVLFKFDCLGDDPLLLQPTLVLGTRVDAQSIV